jgi:dynein heavy chain, axonemal
MCLPIPHPQVFDIVTFEWSQPQAQLQHAGSGSRGAEKKPAWSHQPSPRGGHTASIIDDKVWFFGGYGGQGYSRRDLDDLYTLDYTRWSWSKVISKVSQDDTPPALLAMAPEAHLAILMGLCPWQGKCPERRSGHSSCAVETKLYVFGGGNSVQQFKDLYILDTGGRIC